MLNLISSGGGKLQLVTASAASVDVDISGVDNDPAGFGTVTEFVPFSFSFNALGAATTDIVAAPGTGVRRNVEELSIRNNHASVSTDVTVQRNVSATLTTKFKCTLLAGEELCYNNGTWFHFDVMGAVYASGINITGAPAAASFLDADELLVNEAGTTKKVTGAQLKAWNGDMLQNQSTAAQSPAAATLTYLTGSSIAVPTGKLRIGTRFVWLLDMTKTAAGTASRAFHVRIGTAGTTADTAVITITSALGTAVVDQGLVLFSVTIRGPLSASCIARAIWNMDHQLPATGFMTVKSEVLQVTSGTFDATVANLIVGLSVTTGASEVITFEQVAVEAKNL